jgi:hypothetical protein
MQQFSSNTTDFPKSRARKRRAVSAAGGLMLTTLAATPALADVNTPILSGLKWRSGASGNAQCLATLRGRAMDAANIFLGHISFPALVKQTTGMRAPKGVPLLVASLPLLTNDTKGQFAQCATGAFDGYFRQIGANLQASGAQGLVVRLGWEANIGSKSHPWGVDTPDQVPSYVQCWRHAALALKAGGPALNIEWTNAKKTANTALHVLAMYPGDDVVDLWGVHYYDGGPVKSTQALWDKFYNATFNGGPWGLGAWLAVTKQHGKKLGVGEYAVWQQGGLAAAQADDPVYIDNMYRFFQANAAGIAYETYFNSMPDQHTLCNDNGTPTAYPNAAARYKADWTLGQ